MKLTHTIFEVKSPSLTPLPKFFMYIGCNKEFPISMSRLYHLTSWHGDKKSEQCHVKQNCNLYRCIVIPKPIFLIFYKLFVLQVI
ncbi:hypothetical protein ETB99_10060 [Anoxybacillus sp. CHMUD]|nr:hypothetical protein [Anoxybacillus sp. CHMUD]